MAITPELSGSSFSCGDPISWPQIEAVPTPENGIAAAGFIEPVAAVSDPWLRTATGWMRQVCEFVDSGGTGSQVIMEMSPDYFNGQDAKAFRRSLLGHLGVRDVHVVRDEPSEPLGTCIVKGRVSAKLSVVVVRRFVLDTSMPRVPVATGQLLIMDGRDEGAEAILRAANGYSYPEAARLHDLLQLAVSDPTNRDDQRAIADILATENRWTVDSAQVAQAALARRRYPNSPHPSALPEFVQYDERRGTLPWGQRRGKPRAGKRPQR